MTETTQFHRLKMRLEYFTCFRFHLDTGMAFDPTEGEGEGRH